MEVNIIRVDPKNKNPKKPKRRRNFVMIAAIALAIAAFGTLVAILLRMAEPRKQQPDANISYIEEIPVVQSYLPEGSLSRPGTKRTIKYIVIHETDNFRTGAGAKAHNEFLVSQANDQELSWHYTVDDHEIYHNLPDDEAAYHASDKMQEDGGNLNGIGIELCVNDDSDYEQTLENSALLTATLLKEYGLRVKDVKKHQDFSPTEKVCPARLIDDGRWEVFLDSVQEQYNELKKQVSE